jgi:murein L,D-transpeptidase YcbB/YkuD
MNRRDLIAGAATVLASSLVPWRSMAAGSDVLAALQDELASGSPCPAERTALRNTIRRMQSTRSPSETGRTLVVDLPSQNLAVYDGRSIAFESRVVVGDRNWETPDLDTQVDYVRLNPTWTVPESILKSRDWRSKLRTDSDYFENLDFEVEVDGRMLSPTEAAATGGHVGRFVQRPGDKNALGRAKIGLKAGNAIYLHDTQDRSAFDENARALSHGCVRVEQILELAAWTLGMQSYDVEDLVSSGDRRDRRDIPSPVRVMTTYFTAWPDLEGTVRYYPDIYDRDGTGSRYCSGNVATYRSAGTIDEPVDDGAPQELYVTGQ